VTLAGRNEPCPCGSGRRYKRCCGFDRARERALEDRLTAIEEIARLAYRSPRLLPDCDAYDGWVRAVLTGTLRPHPEAAIATLGAEESSRILTACLELHPDEWATLSARCGSDRDAVGALLGGAVAAGIRDFQPVGRFAMETVEESESVRGQPLEALAMCLDGSQLWDEDEGLEADRSIALIPEWVDDDEYGLRWDAAIEALAARLLTDWHRRRLARLVARVAQQLPLHGFPHASTAIEAGCVQFASDRALEPRLAATLLEDMVGRDWFGSLRGLALRAA
jgi:hypothetical protein